VLTWEGANTVSNDIQPGFTEKVAIPFVITEDTEPAKLTFEDSDGKVEIPINGNKEE